jgi:putative copper resistance protein D
VRLLPLWLHLLAAAVWLGGLAFQGHLLLPLLRQPGSESAVAAALKRARRIAWAALALLVLTGVYNLTALPPPATWAEGGILRPLALKLFLVVVLLMLSAHRDFALAARLIRAAEAGRGVEPAARTLARVDRALLLLGVALLYLGLAVGRRGFQ